MLRGSREGVSHRIDETGGAFAIHHTNIYQNANFDDVDVNRYDALMIAGGRAPEYLRLNKRVIEIVRQFAAAEKPIAAVCHGAQLLAAADVIRGKRISAYPACAPEVRLAGADYADIEVEYPIPKGSDPVTEVAKCLQYCREALA